MHLVCSHLISVDRQTGDLLHLPSVAVNINYRSDLLIWALLCEKVPDVLSCFHAKRRTGEQGRARPSFGMTPTFQKIKIKIKIK